MSEYNRERVAQALDYGDRKADQNLAELMRQQNLARTERTAFPLGWAEGDSRTMA